MAEVVVFDAVEEILVRLDVEDLLRYKSVCKSWYSLISSTPSFAKAHLKHTYNNINSDLRICFPVMNIITNDRLSLCKLVGSSNGLVCISPSLAQFLITNPSTGEVKQLQPLPYKDRSKLCWGFGYDSSTDDYKVVVGINESDHHMRFQVLTLKSNQWKFLGEVNYTFNTNFGPGFLFNGALHWFMDDHHHHNKHKKVILSFDLSLEKFIEIPQPDDKAYVCDYSNKLGIFEECLCIFDRFSRVPVWVMRKYNVKQSWVLLKDDYVTKIYAVAHNLNCIPDDNWCLCDDKAGNVSLSRCWQNIGAPIFVKSLVSPYLHDKPKKKNDKRNDKLIEEELSLTKC